MTEHVNETPTSQKKKTDKKKKTMITESKMYENSHTKNVALDFHSDFIRFTSKIYWRYSDESSLNLNMPISKCCSELSLLSHKISSVKCFSTYSNDRIGWLRGEKKKNIMKCVWDFCWMLVKALCNLISDLNKCAKLFIKKRKTQIERHFNKQRTGKKIHTPKKSYQKPIKWNGFS